MPVSLADPDHAPAPLSRVPQRPERVLELKATTFEVQARENPFCGTGNADRDWSVASTALAYLASYVRPMAIHVDIIHSPGRRLLCRWNPADLGLRPR